MEISAIDEFRGVECGEKYYYAMKSTGADGSDTDDARHLLNRIIGDYVGRYERAYEVQSEYRNFARFRERLEMLHDSQFSKSDDPVKHFVSMERKWCDISDVSVQGASGGFGMESPPPAEAQAEGDQPPDKERQMRHASRLRQEKWLIEHQCNYKRAGMEVHSMRAVLDLYWRLDQLRSMLLSGNLELQEKALEAVRSRFGRESWQEIRFEEIGCRKSATENATSMLKADHWKKLLKVKWNVEDVNELGCVVEKLPWAWSRNLAVEQHADQFNREFVDAKNAGESIDDTERGVLAGIVAVEAVGCEAGQCRISVRPRMKSAAGDPVKRFFGKLSRNYEAFSYGITPRNLRQRLAFGGGIARRTAFSLGTPKMSGATLKGWLENVSRDEETLRAVIGHPVVIGFGKGGIGGLRLSDQAPDREGVASDGSTGGGAGHLMETTDTDVAKEGDLSKGTEFGWIVAPQTQWDTGGAKWHPHRQYDLAAVVSIPSWWRSVKLTVWTCWRKWDEVELLGENEEGGCDERTGGGPNGDGDIGTKYGYTIKIPGDIGEVSRKLRIEVQRVPYIHDSMIRSALGHYVLHVDRGAEIVIEGGRLWRSTRVTLDTQSSDEILVLPHMEGIVATFDCVKRPHRWPLPPDEAMQYVGRMGNDASGNANGSKIMVYGSEVKVWTNEGVTIPAIPVFVVDTSPEKVGVCETVKMQDEEKSRSRNQPPSLRPGETKPRDTEVNPT